MEKALLVCDINNLWKSARKRFGLGARINYDVLKNIYPDLVGDGSVDQDLVAYVSTHPDHAGDEKFVQILTTLGYEVVDKKLKFVKGVNGPLYNDCRVGLALDTVEKAPEYDTIVLVFGSGDYSDLVSCLREKNKKVVVFAFETAKTHATYAELAELYFLSKDLVYVKKS